MDWFLYDNGLRLERVKREQNLQTNSIWTNTIKTPQVNQWEIFAKEFVSDADSGYKDAAHIQNNLLYLHLSFYRFSFLQD